MATVSISLSFSRITSAWGVSSPGCEMSVYHHYCCRDVVTFRLNSLRDLKKEINKKFNECIPVTFRDDCVNNVEREKDIHIFCFSLDLGQGDK